MEDNISFSIIIPLYNKENSIADTINSVLIQNYINFELIIVDDGSTDYSADVVRKFTDKRIKLYQKENHGVSVARNYGASKALYDWLIFLDGDDKLQPGTLIEFLRLIKKYPKDELFVLKHTSSDDKLYGELLGKKECIFESPFKAVWYKKFNPHPGNYVCKASLFTKVNGFDEHLSYYEDWEFCMRLMLMRRVIFSPFISLVYMTENNEARTKIHDINKTMCFYVENWNLENFWLKNILFQRICQDIKIRKKCNDLEGASILLGICQRKFGKWYKYLNVLCKIRQRFLKYGI